MPTIHDWISFCSDSRHPFTSQFNSLFSERYGADQEVIQERKQSLKTLLEESLRHQFNLDDEVIVVASTGRGRLFMGHTDFEGLGGCTIGCAIPQEILSICQATNDGTIYLTNHSEEYTSDSFSVESIVSQVEDLDLFSTSMIWSPHYWANYIRASFGYYLSKSFCARSKVLDALCRDPKDVSNEKCYRGARIHFGSIGKMSLTANSGVSSSAALTGAFTLSINKLFNLNLTLSELCQSDFGEYFLGKKAGAADKTAQLYAKRGYVMVIGSFPERFIEASEFPNQYLRVYVVQSPIPRLSTPGGYKWILERYTVENAERIYQWAKSVMKRFSAQTFVLCIQTLLQNLSNCERTEAIGLSPSEVNLVKEALGANSQDKTSFFLRDLCSGGLLQDSLGNDESNILRLKLLKLIPEEFEDIDGEKYTLRKAALYGLSEVERGFLYWKDINHLSQKTCKECEIQNSINNILELVRTAHDGDRATTDYRNNFAETKWLKDPRSRCDDDYIDSLISNNINISYIPGGFERSIPEFDDLADSLHEIFGGRVAVRVSAAGMGGTLCIHAESSISFQLEQYFKDMPPKDGGKWELEPLTQGPGTQILDI